MIPNYNAYVIDLANLLVIPPTDPNFVTVLPNIIDDAEQRIYRELDLLATITRNRAGVTTANDRYFVFPQHFVVSENINVFTPVGNIGGPNTTGRRQLIPVSREWMDAVYPDDQACGCCGESVPHYYAMVTDQSIILGPCPDGAYTLEVVGTIRPTPLSSTNTSTYLTDYLPDLFMAESLIFGYSYMKDFGAAADDPKGSMTWSQHYQELWQSANIEEGRKKYASQAWTPKQPTASATPPRQ
jgi:hypothetical protein